MSLLYLKPPFKGIIQIGSNIGQEYKQFRKHTDNILCFEPIKEIYDILVRRCSDAMCVNVALGNKNKNVEMFVADNGGISSSILKPKLHKQVSDVTFSTKITVEQVRLDDYFKRHDLFGRYDTIHIDVQGYEMEALKGAVNVLKDVKQVQAEVSLIELYEGCTTREELDEFMFRQGFDKITFYPFPEYLAGEVLYEKS